MSTLVILGDGNCVTSLPNGNNGDVMTIVAGEPTWNALLTGGVSADVLNILLVGSDNRAYLSCETVQDCIGTAIANGTGLTYDDLTNAISVSGVPITSGEGAPASTTDSPTFYTNTNNGDIYYRDPTGATLLLYSVLSCEVVQDCIGTAIANGTGLTYDDALNALSATGVPLTTGSGAPAATTNSPTIYTNTDTDDVYYRDATGASIIISSIFELTAGPDGVTVDTGPFPVGNTDVLHLFGSTVGFTVTAGKIQAEVELSTDAGNNLTTGSDGKLYASSSVGTLTTTADEKATFATGTLNIPNPLPVARIQRTSKVGLTAAFSGAQSSGTQDGNTLTYLWTAPTQNGTTGSATIGTATAATTTMTFSTPGEYDVTLVVTDQNGNTATAVYTIKVDRVLNVNGIDDGDDLFRTLQGAFDWITANDNAQASSYLIEVIKSPADSARITPNAAKVWISSRAVIPVGIDFPSGTFFWAGGGNQSQIAVTSGSAFTCVNGTVLALDMLNVSSADATADIVSTSGGTLVFVNCTFSGTAVDLTLVDTTATFRNCSLSARLVATSTPNTNSLILTGCILTVVSTAGLLDVNNVALAITACQFSCTNGTAIKNRTSSGYISGCRILIAGTGSNPDFPGVDLDTPLANRVFVFSNNYVSHTGVNGSNISSVVKLVPGSTGAIHIMHNQLIAGRYGIHAVGALTGTVRIGHNQIQGGTLAAIISTSDAAATSALPWLNANFFLNSITGAVTNVTFKPTLDLLEGNYATGDGYTHAGALYTVQGEAVVASTTELIADIDAATGSPGDSPLYTNTVAYWALDETTGLREDSRGTNTLTAAGVSYAAGKQGNAMLVTGSNSAGSTDNAALSTGNVTWYFATWVYPTTDDGGLQTIAAKGESNSNRSWALRIQWLAGYKKVYFDVWDTVNANSPAPGGVAYVASDTFGVLSTNTWYFIECWHNATTDQIGIAVNRIQDTAAFSTGTYDDSGPFTLGQFDTSQNYIGRLDEPMFVKGYMPDTTDRDWLYNGGAGRSFTELYNYGATTINFDVADNSLSNGETVVLKKSLVGVPQFEKFLLTSGASAITGGYRYSATRDMDMSGSNAWLIGDLVYGNVNFTSDIDLNGNDITDIGLIGTSWSTLTLNAAGNWANFGSPYAVAAYKKIGDVVMIRGRVNRTSGADTIILTLPLGVRPLANETFVTGGDDALALIDIGSNGSMTILVGTAATYLVINCVFTTS